MLVAILFLKGHWCWREGKNSVSPSALGPKVSLQEELAWRQTLTHGLKLPEAKVDEEQQSVPLYSWGRLRLQVISEEVRYL